MKTTIETLPDGLIRVVVSCKVPLGEDGRLSVDIDEADPDRIKEHLDKIKAAEDEAEQRALDAKQRFFRKSDKTLLAQARLPRYEECAKAAKEFIESKIPECLNFDEMVLEHEQVTKNTLPKQAAVKLLRIYR